MNLGDDANRLAAEARARVLIDRQLTDAGWSVQDSRSLNLFAAQGVARREATMATGHGRADYLLYVDQRVVGVIEAKPEGTPLSGVPKYGSERVIYLADSLVNVLAEHVAAHGTSGKDRWLFAGESDDPPHQNTVGYWWRKALRDAELSGIKLHDLRHFYASGLIAAGCDVVTVQRSLGHAKATTTLNTYARLWPTAEDRTRKAADSIMSASLGRPVATLAELEASTGDGYPRGR